MINKLRSLYWQIHDQEKGLGRTRELLSSTLEDLETIKQQVRELRSAYGYTGLRLIETPVPVLVEDSPVKSTICKADHFFY